MAGRMRAPDYGEDEELLDQLQSFDASIRRVALQSVALRGEAASALAPEAVRLLLEDDEAEVRRAAAVALGKIGHQALGHSRRVASGLKDEEPSVRAEAARALIGLGNEAVVQNMDKVAVLGGDPEEAVQLAAVECLASCGDAAHLDAALASRFPAVLRAALVTLSRATVGRKKHADTVRGLLGHGDASVRLAAVQCSGELGGVCAPEHLDAMGALCRTEPQVKVRRAAVQALGRCGEAGLPNLLLFFEDADDAVRFFAMDTVASIGGEAAALSTARYLDGASGEERAPARRAALSALGRLRGAALSHAAAVAQRLHDEDFACRLGAIQALSDMGAVSEASALGALASDNNKAVRQAAVTALAKLGADGAHEAQRFLEDEDEAVRQAAVRVFSPLHTKLPAALARPYTGAVACRLLDEDWRVRFAAVVALGDLGATEYIEQIAALAGDADGQVRRSAVTSLEKLAAPAVQVAGFLGDADDRVRQEAERVYTVLGGGVGQGGDDGELSEVD